MIKLVKRKDVDEEKWNRVVMNSPFSQPYALTWYLDSVAENWDALVEDEYTSVMPLPWFKRYGLKCIYQPNYCQQLGVFSNKNSGQLQLNFLKQAQKQALYIQTNLNGSARLIETIPGLTFRPNLILPLAKSYSETSKKFSENHSRNIKKAKRNNCIINLNSVFRSFVDFFEKTGGTNGGKMTVTEKAGFGNLIADAISKKAATLASVSSNEGEILAASLLIHHQDRIINVANCSSHEGKNNGAAHFLFAGMIEHYSTSDHILDFEGSSIPGIARFYEGFGASATSFYTFNPSVFSNIIQRFS